MVATTVTDGGMETDLVFHRGLDLPEFAAFPLLDDEAGRRLLTDYYDGYAAVAAAAGANLRLESPTWRANPDWGARVGYDARELARVNADAVRYLAGLRDAYRERHGDRLGVVRVAGMVGPRGDGYRADGPVDPHVAQRYHQAQADAFAGAGADLLTAYTLTQPGEAVGVVRAARAAGLPVTVSFTVETDGRLPDGTTLADAIAQVDARSRPDHYGVNCAHPTHVARALGEGGTWTERVVGLRCNASRMSHAELDDASELDEGDPRDWSELHTTLLDAFPNLDVLGGCCGTDVRHVAQLWGVREPAALSS